MQTDWLPLYLLIYILFLTQRLATLYSQKEVKSEGTCLRYYLGNITRIYFIINFFKSLHFVPDV